MDIIRSSNKFLLMLVLCMVSFATLPVLAESKEIESASVSASININTASAELLADALKGVGESKALAIVTYRQTHGAFTSVDDLASVKGIGVATVERNRDKISIN